MISGVSTMVPQPSRQDGNEKGGDSKVEHEDTRSLSHRQTSSVSGSTSAAMAQSWEEVRPPAAFGVGDEEDDIESLFLAIAWTEVSTSRVTPVSPGRCVVPVVVVSNSNMDRWEAFEVMKLGHCAPVAQC